jgi:hypothetical protein
VRLFDTSTGDTIKKLEEGKKLYVDLAQASGLVYPLREILPIAKQQGLPVEETPAIR